MTFGVDDYEQAIARIFDAKGNVIGTGFLVAPGYVLTCAHVVLQAIGVQKEKFSEYQGQPQDSITLDFHVLASGQSIQADVVAWLPYNIEKGDVAALKLRSPAPDGATPIPLVKVTRSEVEQDEHSVYGFGKGANGGRSDAYRPKANVAGGRFQLCKVGDSTDETIKPGFSGAPVWNESRECVVGMVATAVIAKDEQQSTAYAIPTKELEPVLKQIDALSLHDLLQQGLDSCESDESRNALRRSLETTFQRCHPNDGETPWRDQLINMAVDRPPMTGWEAESLLIYFAVMLAKIEETPTNVYDQLKAWVERRNLHFPDLLDRLTRDMRTKKVSAGNVCEHLMVTIERVEISGSNQDFRVSIWAIANLETQDAKSLPQPVVQEEKLSIGSLPEFVQRQCRQQFGKKNVPTIHLFVPRDLLCCDVEMQPFGKLQEVLGSLYPLVMRTNLVAHPIGQWYYDDWQEKWEQIEQALDEQTTDVFKDIDCAALADMDMALVADLMDDLADQRAAVLRNCSSFEELFELLVEEKDSALPIALWSRQPDLENDLTTLLDCIVRTFPNRVQQERKKAKRPTDKALLGRHLSLVWEDPRVVPPDMQFDPEAC